MLVGDQDCVDALGLLANGCEAFGKLPEAEPGVDQNASAAGRDERAVTGTAAR